MRNSTPEKVTVIANEASEDLGRKVAAELGLPFTEITRTQFKDGEIYHKLPVDQIGGHDVVIIGATHNDSSHQELMDLVEGSQYWDAASVNVVVPYLGYSTMERAKPDSGEIPKGITRTRQLLRACPDFVAFVDLHSESVMHAHDGHVHTSHIQSDELVVEQIREMNLQDYVLVSPDYGRSKWVAKIAGKLGVSHTAADKDRFDADATMVGQVSAVVKDKIAIICDDMIRTGGSIVQTAERCREAGAKSVMFMASHLVLAGDAREKLRQAGAEKIIGADTYPGTEADEFIEVYSVAKLIANKIRDRLNLPSDE
jgi:ribose-phosphate pyrophosphokinase